MRLFRSTPVVASTVALMLSWCAVRAAAEPPGKAAASKPPWQRLLQGEEARQAAVQEKQVELLQEAGKFAEAVPVAEKLAKRRGELQGLDHWEAVNARWTEEAIRRALRQEEDARKDYATSSALQRMAMGLLGKGRYEEAQPGLDKVLQIRRKVLGEEHPDTAACYNNVAFNLNARGQYAQAAEGFAKALAIRRKVLGEEHPDTATSYNNMAFNLHAQGKYAAAAPGLTKALAIRHKVLGDEHLDTAQSYNNLAGNLQSLGRYAAAAEGNAKALAIRRKVLGEEHPETAQSYNSMAGSLQAQGQHAAAAAHFAKALAINRKVLGEEHAETAQTYNNVGCNLYARGQFRAAGEHFAEALAIRRKVLGEEHRATAQSYGNLAANLQALGQYAAAAEGNAKALAIRRKVLGEEHPETAFSYNNLAFNLQAQGKYAEAAASHAKALAIRRQILGEEHPETAQSYNNLAANLSRQGQYAEAAEGLAKALAIYRKVLGEEHSDTALSYNNVAFNLNAQGKYAEAAQSVAKALAIYRKVLGEEHPDTALSYSNVAFILNAQGKYAEAAQSVAKALAIYRKVLGEEHPDTARSYNNVSFNLSVQGKYAEAQIGYAKALAITSKVLGEEHPDTAASYSSLASSVNALGNYAEAEVMWLRAANCFAKARLRIATVGLERATKTDEFSQLPSLAAVLARNGKPEPAWQRFEESLARGTWDDLSARLRRPAAEQAKQAEFSTRLNRLDLLIEKALAVKEPTAAQQQRGKELLTERRQLQDGFDAFVSQLETTYGPAAGQVFDRQRIQASLSADTAFVGWLDIDGQPKAADPNGEHWAVVVRANGTPVWLRLRGTGSDDAWTDADTHLPADLRAALHTPRGNWQPLAKRLRQQRLEPLLKYLAAGDGHPAVRHLLVLPATALAGVPVEVFADGYTVSYGLSGTLHAHLQQQPKLTTQGLLALGDPVFDSPTVTHKPLPLPPGGVLLTMVVPRSNAALAGLKPNDVLLRYNNTDLTGPADLKLLPPSENAAARVAVTVWRDGKTGKAQVRPGKLGVVLASTPAPQALAELRKWDQRLALRGGDDTWDPLPGTRVEVESLRRLFAVFDSQASEQELYQLATSGALGQYRYVHLATHGEVDDRFPLRSALVLARDHLPDPGNQLDAGLPIYDGRLTAEKVLRQWHLNSELVTLSACQTALGKYERGEGFVGFAQALLLAGSRSVVLSQWKVSDAATALLMERFYQNLLGKRAGLKGPMRKADALAEAKAWLRTLSRDEAVQRTALLSQGVARAKGRPVLPPLPAPPAAPPQTADAAPYAHPYYWAAFVLIGDPN